MTNEVLTRGTEESDCELMERAARVARKIGGSCNGGFGTICPQCAPFGAVDGDKVEIYAYRECYNCNYATREADGRYIAKN